MNNSLITVKLVAINWIISTILSLLLGNRSQKMNKWLLLTGISISITQQYDVQENMYIRLHTGIYNNNNKYNSNEVKQKMYNALWLFLKCRITRTNVMNFHEYVCNILICTKGPIESLVQSRVTLSIYLVQQKIQVLGLTRFKVINRRLAWLISFYQYHLFSEFNHHWYSWQNW